MKVQLQDAVIASDHGEAERTQLARSALLEALLNDARVQACFGKMRRNPNWRRVSADFRRRVRANVCPEAAVAQSALLRANPALRRATSLLVRKLLNCNLRIDPINASPITITVAATNTRAEDQRLLREARRVTSTHVRGRLPCAKQTSIARNAQWYVRHVLPGVSIRKLAREYHRRERPLQDPDKFDHDCALVSKGITETSRLLSLPRDRAKYSLKIRLHAIRGVPNSITSLSYQEY